MYIRSALLLTAAVQLLAGCDQKDHADINVKDKDGNITISANSQHFSMHSDDGNKSEVTISGTGGHFTMHAGDGKSTVDINASGNVDLGGKLPDFITVYPGAKVVTLATGSKEYERRRQSVPLNRM